MTNEPTTKAYFFSCYDALTSARAGKNSHRVEGTSLADAIANLASNLRPFEGWVENGNQLAKISVNDLNAVLFGI